MRGLRGEGEGKVGSDHSAAISLKKQLVRRTEAAAGCDTWIRTSLVIDCTAVLSLIALVFIPAPDKTDLLFALVWDGNGNRNEQMGEESLYQQSHIISQHK